MASYTPTINVVIPAPCSESWESMDGDSRQRHCAACDSQVHNLASMTARQIEALLGAPGPLPCMRIARYEDGSLLVAEERRMQPSYGAMAGVAMAALVSLSCGIAAGQAQVPMMGKVAPPATYTGQVVGQDGRPVAHARVSLRLGEDDNGLRETITDANGNFKIMAWQGVWHIGATGAGGGSKSAPEEVTLKPGEQKAKSPLRLMEIRVTAGAPMVAPKK
jgi:hypothetical protein